MGAAVIRALSGMATRNVADSHQLSSECCCRSPSCPLAQRIHCFVSHQSLALFSRWPLFFAHVCCSSKLTRGPGHTRGLSKRQSVTTASSLELGSRFAHGVSLAIFRNAAVAEQQKWSTRHNMIQFEKCYIGSSLALNHLTYSFLLSKTRKTP